MGAIMPETVRSKAEQDAIVLAIYASATRQARELVPNSYRDDVVQILMVDCLKSLRYGLWIDPPEGLDPFVEDCLRKRRTSHRRNRLRRMIRDFEQVIALSGIENEWMSGEHAVEEDRLSAFTRRVYRRLPALWVRAHKLIRVKHLTYAEAARKLRTSPKCVHNYVTAVQTAFREALPEIGIEPHCSARGGRRLDSDSATGPIDQGETRLTA
jgi:DNA-directed RNA polymerase specialized sigma24 family protein